MFGWRPFVALAVLPILRATCDKASLTFVIDDTYSMQDDIEQVRYEAGAIMDIVLEEKLSLIENIVLVTFNDPEVELRGYTSNRQTLLTALDDIHPHNGDDCPEMSLGGIKTGLQESLPGSFLYVFTDASAKDYWLGDEIKDLCQRKQSQVVFVLTGDCEDATSQEYKVYYDIATNCAGIVFRIEKNEVKNVLETVREAIKGKKTVLTSMMAPANQYTDIPFVIDDHTEYATVSASGSNVFLNVTGPYKRKLDVLTSKNVKMVKLLDPQPGTYNARVTGTTSISVVVVGRTDFYFDHGFSQSPPRSLKETTLIPEAYTETYLSVFVNDPDNSINVLSAQILDQNENNVTAELPLRKVAGNFYVATPFEVPPHIFKVAVNGKVKKTQKDIRRISKIPVKPIVPVLKAPQITTKVPTFYEGVKGDNGIWIPCKVEGSPTPTVVWKVGGTVIVPNDKFSIQDGYLIIKHLEKSDTNKYSCEAKNRAGSDVNIVDVKITDHLDDYGNRHTVHVPKGRQINLRCTLPHGRPTPFRWFKNGKEVMIHTPFYVVNNADFSHTGNYSCHSSGPAGSWTETFEVDVGVAPRFTEPQDREVIQWDGETKEVLYCNAEAKPHPNIRWTLDGVRLDNSEFHENVSKWGHYECEVTNAFGTLQRKFDVKISGCMVPRDENPSTKTSLILSEDLNWPKLYSAGKFLKINANEKLILSCPGDRNNFQKFPALNKIEATCYNGDMFTVHKRLYRYADLKCDKEFYPQIVKTNTTCSKNSSSIKVGYNVDDFVETYTVCFDEDNKIPAYIVSNVSATKYNVSDDVQQWHGYSAVKDNEGAYTCKTPSSSCCYAKSQLVSAHEFSYGAPQSTTFIHPLNAIPLWIPCNNRTTWEEINDMVRHQAKIHSPFVIASGTHTLQTVNGSTIPRYLWKVVKIADEEPMAIVYVNDPTPTSDDILCPDVCTPEFDSWLHHSDEHTYCCAIDSFYDAFRLPNVIQTGAGEAEHSLQ